MRKVLFLTLIFGFTKVSWAQSTAAVSSVVSATAIATSSELALQTSEKNLQGYAHCPSRKYNNAYRESTIKIYREKGENYLIKSSKFLKKDYPLFIKGWISEADCKVVMLKSDSSLQILNLKGQEAVVKSKAKLKLNRIYFVSQELPSQFFRHTYLAAHSAELSDEKKRKSTLTGLVIGTQIHANSLFRLNVEFQSDVWVDKLSSATKNIFFLGFASCAQIDSLTGLLTKIDLCAKLLVGKSSDPNVHVKYNFAPQINFDFNRSWRAYGQGGLTSVVSRIDGMPDNIFGFDAELGLAYRF